MLEDSSPMPFGKYKGKSMEDVPASYLLWLFDEMNDKQTLSPDSQLVKAYIEDNIDVLNKEANE